jgi:hypothetical protein
MPFICNICQSDPTSHSLTYLGLRDDIAYYYTCPAKATKYYDTDGIITHYDGVLSQNTNKWIWIFDCKDYTMKHLLEINVGIQLAKLIINKFSHNLINIIIINPNWYTKCIIQLIYPFLNNHMKSIITII